MIGDVFRRAGGDGEANADEPVTHGIEQRRVDANDLPLLIDQWAAGVAMVDRGVGLDVGCRTAYP